ncbi:MAG: hypothetical protein IJS88_02540 [Alphaproteobacteria bacterium]|nr:hypothetical protein [Alphaproteobacteria bacterium]
MIKNIYLCFDKQSYKFTLAHYANKHTKVHYCHFHKNTKRISRYILGGAKKNIYVMRKYDSGYLKFDFWKYAANNSNIFIGYYIPIGIHSGLCGRKPVEYYVEGLIVGNKLIPFDC